jgi:integrase
MRRSSFEVSVKQHVVPLSTAALAVLDRQRRVRTGDAVFPGRSGAPLFYASFATAPAKAGIDACTPHGWRSCFRDWCGDIGDVPRDLAEAALAHSLNATEGAGSLHSHLTLASRAMAPRPHKRVAAHAAAAVSRRTERPPREGHSGCVLRG